MPADAKAAIVGVARMVQQDVARHAELSELASYQK